MAYCRKCGAKMDGRAIFCPSCGTKVITPVIETPSGSIETSRQREGHAWSQVQAAQSAQAGSEKSKGTSVWGWIGWFILTGILPLIGALFMISNGADDSTKNYGKVLALVQVIELLWILIKWEEIYSMLRWFF